MNDKNQWREWNIQGFIPGPEETEVSFYERIAYCKNLEKALVEKTDVDFPFEVEDQNSKNILLEALFKTKELYGIYPDWVLLFFSNYQLTPWHGGCAWIFQLGEKTPTAAFLQLRRQFRNSASFLGIYQRRELIAHELAHVGRMLYQEPQFEEIIAYQSSSSHWRRWLSPIVQSAKESLFFIFLLGLIIFTDIALFSVGSTPLAHIAWWLKFVPFIFILFGLLRLTYRQQIFKRCLKHLGVLYSPEKARHLIYRLRDQEIKQFSRLSPQGIQNFIKEASEKSFRWRFLNDLY